ncbi:hypothetical protein [Aeoliella mucimassa]|uniref:PEP-CTERM protein-sorting domain-containing protein n=1 Tax=Aeoliella mucimassa TaxID=2527972 RepID=A0A518AQP0_9BACT|nr:hypothetical protein [Aeoliella mucimassa]QDU57038.1 hypothetical protein Pan181_32520 [Aeoliella mucimassa]
MHNRPLYWALLLLSATALNHVWLRSCTAAPAAFWFSTDATLPGTPGVPEFTSAVGIPRTLHIWAQPNTLTSGDWNASTNPFLKFQNVSLDIVSPESTFDIDPDSIVVYNPTYASGEDRFSNVGDSSTGLTESDGSALGSYDDLPIGFSKGLLDLQGFSMPANYAQGFGVTCDASDSYCGTTDSGSPAWLFASFAVTPTSDTGSVEFWMQIGRNGINGVDASDALLGSGTIEVQFGIDTEGFAPFDYDAEYDRKLTLANDDSDVTLLLAGPGDYNADGAVDELDYAVWKKDFGTNSYDADGNGDGIVSLADYTIWRDNLDATSTGALASLNVSQVPEPSTFAMLAGFTTLAWNLSSSSRARHSSNCE